MTKLYARYNPQPMQEMNLTPLIDVLLVLLILFLVTLPVMTHKVPIELPPPGPVADEPPPSHRVGIMPNGTIFLDGNPVAQSALLGRFEQIAADPANPLLEIAPDGGANYELVDEILADVARAEIRRIGFVGNHAFAEF